MGTILLGGFNLKKGWTDPGTFYSWAHEAVREETGGRNIGRTFSFCSYFLRSILYICGHELSVVQELEFFKAREPEPSLHAPDIMIE